MIKDLDGEKTTPKKLAQDIIMDQIALAIGYGLEKYDSYEGDLTEREGKLVQEQIEKQANRVAKIFGYERAWSA